VRWDQQEKNMKHILMVQEDSLLEPFRSVMELATDYGFFPILETVYELLECQREGVSHCVKCYRKTELLHSGLGQLLRAYRRDFPPKVEVVGEGIVQ
jgi:hypothetical protein